MKEGYVYLMVAESNPPRYKIGITRRKIKERLDELNRRQSPYPIKLLAYFYNKDCYKCEALFHRKYASYKVHNEYYEFPEKVLKEVLATYKSYQGEIVTLAPDKKIVNILNVSRQQANKYKQQAAKYRTNPDSKSQLLTTGAFLIYSLLIFVFLSGVTAIAYKSKINSFCDSQICEVKK